MQDPVVLLTALLRINQVAQDLQVFAINPFIPIQVRIRIVFRVTDFTAQGIF